MTKDKATNTKTKKHLPKDQQQSLWGSTMVTCRHPALERKVSTVTWTLLLWLGTTMGRV